MIEIIRLNQDWLFCPKNLRNGQHTSCNEKLFTRVTLPHMNPLLPWHDFDEKTYQSVSWYRRWFRPSPRWKGNRVRLAFDGVMIAAQVWINNQYIGEHKGGYTPFTFDITDHLAWNKNNLIAVCVDSRERPDIPPCGGLIDYLLFAGIYRDVRLEILPSVYIADVFAKPRLNNLETDILITNTTADTVCTSVSIRLGGNAVRENVEVAAHSSRTVSLNLDHLDVKPWSLDAPQLYTLQTALRSCDKVSTRIGFREARFEKDGRFYLNGTPVKLIGLDRHQTFPYVGGAMPDRVQARDADILKYELGLNIVRTSHYPQSPAFLNRCDEIGLLVFEELPGWQHIGDEAWKEISKQELREMILRDRNHPSIVLWGVRINESRDDHDFYTETNRIAHELDPTRQTGGVRYFQESEFLEDVFTFNDFSNDVQIPKNRPHLITEFNGHMFPTKSFDQEERLIEHALRHARIQNKQMGMDEVAGAIGWCAFDYNTHAEFGSGDRICYHGVMDIFRFPKFAAHFYKSQRNPKYGYVLEPASHLKIGERSGGGFDPLYVFSNCETVEIWVDNKCYGSYEPDRENFPHLPHPPFRCSGFATWGHRCADIEFRGKVNGKVVIKKLIAGDGVSQKLYLAADDYVLNADGSDCTRVVFGLTDPFGNFLPYATGSVFFSLIGPAEIIGENPFALVAGRGAVWMKAGTRPGEAILRAEKKGLPPKEIKVRIRKKD
ncbi:MAG TPA: glycoside hydrolase family 2 TIM barrel-domain containing protein [Candidatus Hydrogenedentes bacterium]|nr:glycoside hydrolase family 2 TIM barrel-domain containing protein [Candidatus Hydrogenedentota bacterium]HOL76869.1 glycoside hydrolase family 2 TIM barrel-domain containing protein [Candidatus Hydrogenedentota bacterium]HPO85520.1 glycoside hydrolase family 2 TIM barrel-domain containing protein [Candidatus Hydrogenedentota bacterium]